MADPLFAGAVHVTVSDPLPGAAVGAAGALGAPGVFVVEGDQSPSPTALEARTCTW